MSFRSVRSVSGDADESLEFEVCIWSLYHVCQYNGTPDDIEKLGILMIFPN